jgi:microcystin-dependent protein
MGQGAGLQNYSIAEMVGVEVVTLTTSQIPAHTHTAIGDGTNGGQNSPGNNFWGTTTAAKQYLPAATASMNAAALSSAGGSQPHDNMLPFLVINFILSLFGVFPSQN